MLDVNDPSNPAFRGEPTDPILSCLTSNEDPCSFDDEGAAYGWRGGRRWKRLPPLQVGEDRRESEAHEYRYEKFGRMLECPGDVNLELLVGCDNECPGPNHPQPYLSGVGVGAFEKKNYRPEETMKPGLTWGMSKQQVDNLDSQYD